MYGIYKMCSIYKICCIYWICLSCRIQKGMVRKMAAKTDTEVIIGGKVFTLSGYESEEYLQKVASYINNKIAEYNKIASR